MIETSYNITELFIFELKQSIDDICEKYGDDARLDFFAYARNEYGVMQRAELEAIAGTLVWLKKHVDGLFEDCLKMPAKFKGDDESDPKTIMDDKISLVEMLNALEA